MATDEELYGQYLSGDETGLELLIKKYGDPLTLYIDGYLHDVHEAEDLMMETFSWLFTKKPRIRDGCFKAYLYKAARHMALRHKSRRRIIFSLDDLTREPEVQTLVDEVIRTKERNQILHLCMDELNSDYREALYLTYFEGMSYQQAAKVMGKSVKQITNMVYRGKERLRGLLQREGIKICNIIKLSTNSKINSSIYCFPIINSSAYITIAVLCCSHYNLLTHKVRCHIL